MKIACAALALFFAIASFLFGLHVGGAPLRQHIAISGGASGSISTMLQDSASSFSWPNGRSRDKEDIVVRQIKLAHARSLLAAQFLCEMPPTYRAAAKQAATRLLTSPYISNQEHTALTFIATAQNPTEQDCQRWNDAGTGPNLAA